MNKISGKAIFARHVFSAATKDDFAACYPEQARVFDHLMTAHELLTLDALAKLGTAQPGDVAQAVLWEPRSRSGVSHDV